MQKMTIVSHSTVTDSLQLEQLIHSFAFPLFLITVSTILKNFFLSFAVSQSTASQS
jgi:hypothetical protein